MLLIADSGSTKCDWRLVAQDKSYTDFKSIGFNPYFHNEEIIEMELRKNAEFMAFADQVKAVFFFGAGCSSASLKRIVERGLGNVFTNAQVAVDHDMVAAAFSVYDGEPCIACILGTGSNSCHFDGDIVREEIPALAYILGDEGSGSYYGKKLLSDFLYKRLPPKIRVGLIDQFGLTKDIIMEHVYMRPNANVYLASFMRFITSMRSEPYVVEMIREGLEKFVDTHVLCYRDARELKTSFIGSVAHYQSDILKEVAASRNIKIGQISKKPIDGLYQYFLNQYFQKIPF